MSNVATLSETKPTPSATIIGNCSTSKPTGLFIDLLLTLTAIYVQEIRLTAVWIAVASGILSFAMRRVGLNPALLDRRHIGRKPRRERTTISFGKLSYSDIPLLSGDWNCTNQFLRHG